MKSRLRGVQSRVHGLAMRLAVVRARLAGGLMDEGGNFGEPINWGIGIVGALVVGAVVVNTLAPDLTKAMVNWASGFTGITPPSITP